MHFSRETVCAEFFEEITPLLEKHFHEIAHFQDIPLKPNFQRYIDIDRAGCLRTFTARDEFQKLVGYAVFFVQPNIHYQTSLQAVQDVIYLEKSQRGAGIGKLFIAWCDEELKLDGCQAVYHHVKENHKALGKCVESLGYKLVDLIYTRRLDKEGV